MKTPSLKTLSLSMLAGAAALSLSTMAEARGPGGHGGERPAFEEFDSNGDGSVTIEEIQAFGETRAAERFAAADTNGDGGLSAEEIAAAAEGRADARAERRFDRMDANDDGLISQDELEAGRGGKGRGGDHDRDHGKREGRGGERGGDRGGLERMFERADADSSGGLDADEWNEMGQGRGRR